MRGPLDLMNHDAASYVLARYNGFQSSISSSSYQKAITMCRTFPFAALRSSMLMFAFATAFLTPLALVGCSKSEPTTTAPIGLPPEDDHDHDHQHPETFAAAMEQLGEFKSQIQTAFTTGTPDDAHDALHEIGHVLGELPELAGKVTDDAAKKEAVAAATEKLFNAYEKLDASMHGGDEVKYDALQADIDEAFATLEGIDK